MEDQIKQLRPDQVRHKKIKLRNRAANKAARKARQIMRSRKK